MLKDFLIANWDKLVNAAVPSSLQLVPISSCLHEYGNDLVLVFADGRKYPDYVMKISRSREYSFKIKNEYSALRYLRTVNDLPRYIPAPYSISDFGSRTILIQGGVRGTSLFGKLIKRGMNKTNRDLLNQAVDLLVMINSVKIHDNPGDFCSKEKFPDILEQYGTDLIGQGFSNELIDEVKEHYLFFYRSENTYFEHGDFWQTNIMIDDNGICGLIDWEFAFPVSHLPTDIIWFLINLGHCLHLYRNPEADIPESFTWAFMNRGEQNEIIRSLFSRYAAGIGLDRNLFKVMLKITLVKMSLRELAAYGRHTNMDFACMDMLRYLMQNERKIMTV